MTSPNFYKQKKKLGYNRCSECGAKASAESARKRRINSTSNTDAVEVVCPGCGKARTVQRRTAKLNNLCISCSRKSSRGIYDKSYENRKGNKEFSEAVKLGMGKMPKSKLVDNAKKASSYWADEDRKAGIIEKRRSEPYRESMRKIWSIPGYRERMQKIARENALRLWKDPAYREKMAVVRSNMPRISSIQLVLYSILDDLGVVYEAEHQIGPYCFDCAIQLHNKTLLIECQGEYWHSLGKAVRNDKAKSTYVERYCKDYELRYLWEHEFGCKDRVIELIKYWVGLSSIEAVDFEFGDINIKPSTADEYRSLLSKYHYLSNAGRGGNVLGAYLMDCLVAVCVFSPLTRQNLPWDRETTRELSRLCIHPRYQKKNFASWFVSRCIKRLPDKYRTVISYCDTTFNHNGATYKACNFRLDGEVKPDYWYVSINGWVMHKKTLYNRARKMSLTESEYATKHNYNKVFGEKKLRFVYER